MRNSRQLLGLTNSEVQKRQIQFGFNELEERRLATFLENFLKIFLDPMGLMLLVLGLVYWLLGKTSDSIILLAAYIPIVAVDVILELRSQKALRALKKSLKTTCHVLREGKTISLPIRELVPGDLLLLEEGQTLPADGALLQCSNLTIDESSLTGESIPVEKQEGSEALSGTTTLTGTGIVEIQKTGLHSQIGSVAKVLREFEATPSPLLATIKKSVRYLFLASLALAAIVFFVSLRNHHGAGESLVAALTLAMAAIPEEFPLVFTLYLSLAAYRLSKRGILVKSLPAVEGLGRVDVICTDKTGTLTEGKFRLENILEFIPSLSPETLSHAMVFSCEPKAVDAMESSILEAATTRWGEPTLSALHSKWDLQFDYPFDTKEKYMCHVWQEQASGRQFLAMKGALEGVLAHCGPSTDTAAILKLAEQEAARGKRLLGLACKEGSFTGRRIEDEQALTFLALLCFADPVRPSVPAAIRECAERNIQLKMLTGDHLLTAHSIADAIGLPHKHDELFSGPDLEKMTVSSRRSAYMRGAIFARLKPEQKLELVEALKSEGKIVAMTGDGINDAPALKLADVGISMGERATDVARSSAQMILLKNDFGGIVDAIREGRNVMKSLSESFGYLIAFHIPIVSIALAQSLFFDITILQPVHIVLMELIVHPVSAFVFSETDTRSPGSDRRTFITARQIVGSSLRGIALTALCLLVFFHSPGTEAARSSLAVLLLVAGNIGLLLAETGGILHSVMHHTRRNLLASLILFLVTATLAYVPFISPIFSIAAPSLALFGAIVGVGILLGAVRVPVEE